MHPSRRQDVPGQQFRFPKEKGYFPSRPSTARNQRSLPAALGTPRLRSAPAGDLPTRLRSPPGSPEVPERRRGVAIGIAFRTLALDAGGQAEGGGSRRPPRPGRPRPVVPFQGCRAQPAAPPQLPRCPARLHKNPTFRHVGPALPAASREERR